MTYNENPEAGWEAGVIRSIKVRQIFEAFDNNKDGGLDRTEMARLVMAVNPKVKFKDEQIEAILDEVFRTYGEYIHGDYGLSLDGLQRTYDDGAGDVDRDFQALGLVLKLPDGLGPAPAEQAEKSLPDISENAPLEESKEKVPSPEEDKGGYDYLTTKKLMDELEQILAHHRRGGSTVEPSNGLTRALDEWRVKADRNPPEETLEANVSGARLLMKVGRPEEAAKCLVRAVKLDPANVRAHFLLGNAHYSLGALSEARGAYERSLEAGKADPDAHATILPQVHVNLGIVLEEEGLLMNSCQHYREAAMLNPHHHRAMKLLGSALYGLGEFHAAEEALQNALYLEPDYVDAHCDLGSTLHALGEDERAGQAFERALTLQPSHVDALYNYAGLLRDTGHFMDAVDQYSRVLELQPDHWQAQLNRAISLLGAGRGAEAQKELDAAYRRTNRVELYDTVKQLKRLYKENKKMSRVLEGLATEESAEGAEGGAEHVVEKSSYAVVDLEQIQNKDAEVSPPGQLALALDVRAFQRHIRLSHVEASSIRKYLTDKVGPSGEPPERMVPKAEVEQLVRGLLPAELPAETFQQAMRALNEKVLVAVENAGVIDLGLFLAMVALLCTGEVAVRKAVAYEALQWRRGALASAGPVAQRDAEGFLKLVRQVYLPSQPEVPDPEGEQPLEVHLDEFRLLVDEHFPILNTMVKLETYDRTRHLGMSCAVCRYAIVGLRFREAKSKFDLCATCYSECKVPVRWHKQKSFCFNEYVGGTDKVRSSLGLYYGRSLSRATTKGGTLRSGSANQGQVVEPHGA